MERETSAKSAAGRARKKAPTVVWSPAQRDAVTAYIGMLTTQLRLQDWTITIDFDTPAEGAYADMADSPNSKYAQLRLGTAFLDATDRERTQTLIHEMVHCHLFQLTSTVESMVSLLPSAASVRLAENVLTGQVEVTVDALADVLLGLLPDFVLPVEDGQSKLMRT